MADGNLEIKNSNVALLTYALAMNGFGIKINDMAIIDGVIAITVSNIINGKCSPEIIYRMDSINNLFIEKYKILVGRGELKPIEQMQHEEKMKLWTSIPEEYRSADNARARFMLDALS
jgi:uncharacterized membrane protein